MLKILLAVSLIISVINVNAFDIEGYERFIKHVPHSTRIEFLAHLKSLLEADENYFAYKPTGEEFKCNPDYLTDKLLNEVVTVNNLKPSDIKVVGAVGDSLTAALGARATNIAELLFEYRGVSFSAGGDNTLETTITMPNILKKYSNKLTGFSTGETWLYTKTGDKLNMAISGSEAYELLDQVKRLIQRMQNSSNIDYKNDWKLITVFIGSNDICETCTGQNQSLPENYINYVKDCLDLLKETVPRALVNVVSVLNISPVRKMNHNIFCTELHKYECSCGAFPASSRDEEKISERFNEYTNSLNELIKSGRYDQTDDFTVVLQPFFRNYTIPETNDGTIDFTYFAPDCFHFSSKTHTLAGISLWNNMLQPVGNKQHTIYFDKKILCPSAERPYIFTNKNSEKFNLV